MVMSVFERTQEIGTLRSMGWKKRQILLLIEFEAAILGLGGGICWASLLGWGSLRILASLPQTATFVSATLEWPLVVQAMVIALMAGLIAGAVPAWRAGKLSSPVDALRHD